MSEASQVSGVHAVASTRSPANRMMKFEGRELTETLNESKYYKFVKRYTVGVSSNSVWLYTVDVVEDIQTKKPIVRLRRWVARFAEGKPVWRPTRAYNVRSKEQWDQASGVIEASLHGLRRMADSRFRPAIQLLGGTDAPVGAHPIPEADQVFVHRRTGARADRGRI